MHAHRHGARTPARMRRAHRPFSAESGLARYSEEAESELTTRRHGAPLKILGATPDGVAQLPFQRNPSWPVGGTEGPGTPRAQPPRRAHTSRPDSMAQAPPGARAVIPAAGPPARIAGWDGAGCRWRRPASPGRFLHGRAVVRIETSLCRPVRALLLPTAAALDKGRRAMPPGLAEAPRRARRESLDILPSR